MYKEHIGILGGSFDPVHKGHIAIARSAINILKLNKILLIPCAIHSQKSQLIASIKHRLSMLKIAVQYENNIYVDEIETKVNEINYTIDTIKYFYTQRKNHIYYLIIGSDQLINFCSWLEWDKIIDLVDLVVFSRANKKIFIPNDLNRKLLEKNKYIRLLPNLFHKISSTSIRHKINNKKLNFDKINELEKPIIEYIKKFNLYINK
ncbi:Nicotinate-nucleotide adenylyltransferase [Candidatus Kinetoplastibacterium sorsogonicusi]|uniref:Probable nicotinate-nucleotide adenylyltransferase n=1 Tax=Candidatus Kinetoplastidibacterium kentomonadis TaxID=1576550 RepID=A0A3Q8EU05_9PROT|nr:nicotinate (nicotinamide) nucleotide adenylyltransferase [Candidatus Kinetoplastibacterium sorsogonicusi]AWD32323.1 Nicotinate-nucleotide adenylyltransferase [Candidatus Kinetoplastibacterium sorsogonicusi]